MGKWFSNRLESLFDNVIGSAIFAGIVAMITAIRNLPTWQITLIAVVVFIVMIIILRIIWRILKKKKGYDTEHKLELKIGTKIKEITPHGYYANLFSNHLEGDKRIVMDVILSPLSPMTLDVLALEIWGKKYDVEGLPIKVIKSTATYEVVFNVEKDIAIDTEEAKIYALASNLDWYSEPYTIRFVE